MSRRIASIAGLAVVLFFPGFFFSLLYSNPAKANKPAGYYPGDPLPDHMAYLTFDDGPSDWTEDVLEILDSQNVKATFFICANWLPGSTPENNSFKKYRETLERMIEDGHSIGNHTRSHKNFSKINAQEIAAQLDKNQELFDQELGSLSFPLTLIRPPFGEPWFSNNNRVAMERSTSVVASRGLVILWSRHFFSGDSMDWVQGDWYEAGSKVNIDHTEFKKKMMSIYNRLIHKVNGGGMIILLHDTHRTSIETLPLVIDKLKELGYEFGTIEDYIRWRWKTSSKDMIRDMTRKEQVFAF